MTDDVLFGILLLNFLLNFVEHYIEVKLVLIVFTFSYHRYM